MIENANDTEKSIKEHQYYKCYTSVMVECPFCYHSPAVIMCALCGSRGYVLEKVAEEYKKIEDPTVDDRIRIRRKYEGTNALVDTKTA
jgi:hypothetical protein